MNDYIWFDICTVNQHVWKNVDFQTTFKFFYVKKTLIDSIFRKSKQHFFYSDFSA